MQVPSYPKSLLLFAAVSLFLAVLVLGSTLLYLQGVAKRDELYALERNLTAAKISSENDVALWQSAMSERRHVVALQ